ncbi:MAG TPA: MFS transporter [Solirubrobacteraceae bacterium]|nr:MFS transporter [Solirubrobacteraceae bacterium]
MRTEREAVRWPALVALSLGFGVVQLDVTVVNVAVNRIGASIGGGVSAMQWVVSAYTLAFASLILSAGAFGDRVGAKRVFVAGFALFTLASAACAAAPDVGVLIAARAVQGVGAAVLVPCSLALLNHAYDDPGARARAVGWWAAGASCAFAAGPVLGGVLIAVAGWRSIFLINLPLGALAIAVVRRHLAETSRSPGRGLDVRGQALGALALGLAATATIEGGAVGFGAPLVLVAYLVAAASAVGFVVVESRGSEPMLPLGLFGEPTFGATAAIGLLINVCFYGLIFVFSLLFQRAHGLSPLDAGLGFLPMTVAVGAANVLAGRLAERYGVGMVIASGLVLMAATSGVLAATVSGASPVAIAAILIALGGGIGLVVPLVTSEMLGSVPRARSGIASATLNSSRQTGSVIGVALFGSLIAGHRDILSGVQLALLISIALLLTSTVLCRRLGPQREGMLGRESSHGRNLSTR